MRLRAAYTVEASIIVPLFTVIIVVLIQLMLFLHDRAVYSAVEVKTGIQEEFTGKSYEKEAAQYLENRLILKNGEYKIENVKIKENNMPKFARISKALSGGKEEWIQK